MREQHPHNNEKYGRQKMALRGRLPKVRELLLRHVPPTASLVDELLAERREEVRRESDQDS